MLRDFLFYNIVHKKLTMHQLQDSEAVRRSCALFAEASSKLTVVRKEAFQFTWLYITG